LYVVKLDCALYVTRDSIGDSAISGDFRWAGFLGVNVDFVARSHCSVEYISLEDMKVCPWPVDTKFEDRVLK
jgi:hypothetical protein